MYSIGIMAGGRRRKKKKKFFVEGISSGLIGLGRLLLRQLKKLSHTHTSTYTLPIYQHHPS